MPPFGFPALLDWSGGCGTRATRSNSPRRHPLTSLRYSAAHRGMKIKTQKQQSMESCAHHALKSNAMLTLLIHLLPAICVKGDFYKLANCVFLFFVYGRIKANTVLPELSIVSKFIKAIFFNNVINLLRF